VSVCQGCDDAVLTRDEIQLCVAAANQEMQTNVNRKTFCLLVLFSL